MDVEEIYTRADISQRAQAIGMGTLAGETLSCVHRWSSARDESQFWQPMDVVDFAVRFTARRLASKQFRESGSPLE